MGVITNEEIDRRFDSHAGNEPDHQATRANFKALAEELMERLPEGREKSLAFTALEESAFWAHAAIAREPVT